MQHDPSIGRKIPVGSDEFSPLFSIRSNQMVIAPAKQRVQPPGLDLPRAMINNCCLAKIWNRVRLIRRREFLSYWPLCPLSIGMGTLDQTW